jgi:hypothetical protein
MKQISLALLLLLLTGCPDTGTGGMPAANPGAAMVSANATGTAAALNVTGTAVSANSTINAAYYQATTSAQSTAVYATTAAMPTVTAQAELESVIAQGQAVENAIRADVLRAEATATAVHLQELMAWERAQTAKRAQSAQFWQWAKPIMLVLFSFAVYKFVMVASNAIGWRFTPQPEAVFDEAGNLVATAPGYRHVVSQNGNVTITQPAPPRQTQTFEIDVRTARGIITLSQPGPASFRTWLREVLADGNRVQFSENESTRRGWSAEQYGHLIYELRQSFWLHDIDGNGVYRMTDAGKAQAREWLGISTPPPNE